MRNLNPMKRLESLREKALAGCRFGFGVPLSGGSRAMPPEGGNPNRAVLCAAHSADPHAMIRHDDAQRPGAPYLVARRAFTLIELILVLALLAVVTSLSAPSLSRFFRGRTLNSETRQLLSLTHAGQSRAVSEGFPVLLWIDTQGREYGLQLETTSSKGNSPDADPKAEQFAFDDNLKIEAVNAPSVTLNGRSVAAIRFLPDGAADETSPTTLRVASRNGEVLWLIQATNRLSYEIRNSDK